MMNESRNASGNSFQESLAALAVYALEQDDLEQITHRAIQQSCALLNLKCAAVMLLDNENNTFKMLSESGCGCKDLEVKNDRKWDLGYALESKKAINVWDYKDEKRFRISPFMAEGSFVSSVSIAIRGTEKVYGVFSVYSQEKRKFNDEDLHFIQVASTIIGRSIEQKEYKEKLLETNKQLQEEMERTQKVKREILNENVLERWELGGYLHDNFGQLLASIKILADDIKFKVRDHHTDIGEEIEELKIIVDECITGIRDVIHDIIPVDVELEGMAQAFRMVMNQTFKMYDVTGLLEDYDLLNEIRNRNVATHLYYIVQEAFKNAATHGKAEMIVISAKKDDDYFYLEIKDNGKGLKAKQNGNGKGIRIMKHRMDLLEGSLDMKDYNDGEQSGTIITCKLPLHKLKREENPED